MSQRGPGDSAAPPQRLSALTRLVAGAVIALALLAIVGFLRGPQATLAALREAAVRRDTAEIERRIDGPALRHSLGRLLLQQTGAALQGGASDDNLMMGQFIIAGALVKPLVETLLRPEGIAALLDGQVAARPLAPPGALPAPKVSYAWSGLSTVRATVVTPAGDPGLVLVLRHDRWSWRLAGVESVAVVKAAPVRPAR